jgi:hypothetical protein
LLPYFQRRSRLPGARVFTLTEILRSISIAGDSTDMHKRLEKLYKAADKLKAGQRHLNARQRRRLDHNSKAIVMA